MSPSGRGRVQERWLRNREILGGCRPSFHYSESGFGRIEELVLSGCAVTRPREAPARKADIVVYQEAPYANE